MDVLSGFSLIFGFLDADLNKKNTSTLVTKMCSGVGDPVALKGSGGEVRGALPILDRIWVNSANGIQKSQPAKKAKTSTKKSAKVKKVSKK